MYIYMRLREIGVLYFEVYNVLYDIRATRHSYIIFQQDAIRVL